MGATSPLSPPAIKDSLPLLSCLAAKLSAITIVATPTTQMPTARKWISLYLAWRMNHDKAISTGIPQQSSSCVYREMVWLETHPKSALHYPESKCTGFCFPPPSDVNESHRATPADLFNRGVRPTSYHEKHFATEGWAGARGLFSPGRRALM